MSILASVSLLCSALPYSSALFAQTPKIRAATLLWQVDGSESGEHFANVRDLVLMKDGSTWVLDFKDQRIRRFDAKGKELSTVGREGSGPGEIRNANGMAVAFDGNVWVNDPANGRFVVFTPDGKPLKTVSRKINGYGFRWDAWFEGSSELVEPTISREAKFRRLDLTAKELGMLAYPNCGRHSTTTQFYRGESSDGSSTNGSYPFTQGGGVAPDRLGHFWCTSARGTRVARLAYGKTDTLALTAVDIPLLSVSRAERDVVVGSLQKNLQQYATNNFDPSQVPTTKSGIAALHVDHDNRLWVAHTPPWLKAVTVFDVFDAAGKSLFRVSLPVRHHSSMPVLSQGNDFVMAIMDDDEVVKIARYRLKP